MGKNNNQGPGVYDHKEISQKVEKYHQGKNEFFTDTKDLKTPKFYSLGMFPYPSGNAHMGHVRVYTLSDVKARFKKLQGFNTLHPMGWDSFGLPAENAAIKHKVRPDLWTQQNIAKMKGEQLAKEGWSFDWDKELTTSSPDYYRWTQWLFLQLYHANMAYRKADYVNWCPIDKTVLANEQVIDGKCYRDDAVVEKKLMQQWFFKITEYAPKLWNDIPKLKNWAKEAVSVQKNWINQSQGTKIDFYVEEFDETVTVFTTRPDTLFGVTAMVIAPEHPLAAKILKKYPQKDLEQYISSALKRSVVERMQNKEKTGVNTGVRCQHPFKDQAQHPQIDIWVGDYVIANYGTGAVMCVPAHDTRDFEFAKKFKLPIIQVINSGTHELTQAYTEEGELINSAQFNGLPNKKAIDAITKELEKKNLGSHTITYQLKDWSVGRQRFWGCPIPMVHCESCGEVPVPENQLPVILPTAQEDNMEGINLKKFDEWKKTTCPKCQKQAQRETDTLDTFLCSAWYAFRFIDNKNESKIFDSDRVNYFMPIDFYVGGLEHAAQHMLYFRFITKFLYDQGHLNFDEPVDHFFCNGMVNKDGAKMSKSKGNVVVPTETLQQYGPDALRLYILSDTPSELDIDWDDSGIQAKHDFIKKMYNSIEKFLDQNKNLCAVSEVSQYSNQDFLYSFYPALSYLEKTLETNNFHSSVAQIHTLSNFLLKELNSAKEANDKAILKHLTHHFVIAIGPLAPFFTEVLLKEYISADASLYKSTWPSINSNYMAKDTVKIVVQINGKKRALIEMKKDLEESEVEKEVFSHQEVVKHTDGKTLRKKIYVPNKIYNIVVS